MVEGVIKSLKLILPFISTVTDFCAFDSKPELTVMGHIKIEEREAKQRRKKKENPIFINMEMLPDVRSLEDKLAHLLTSWLKRELSAKVKYLECFSCCMKHVLNNKTRKTGGGSH